MGLSARSTIVLVDYHPCCAAKTPTMTIDDSMDAPPTSEPSSEQPPAQPSSEEPPAPSSDSPGPTPVEAKPANNEEAENEEEAEEARRARRAQRWGIERVLIKPKESREPRKRERATGGEAQQVPGSTLEGGRRRCDTCGKTFAERDVASFRKHVCGRAQGGARGERETAERKERGRKDGEGEESEEEGEEGVRCGWRAKKARAAAEGEEEGEGEGEGKEDEEGEGEGEGVEARKAAKRAERERKRAERAERERPVRDGPPPQVEGS